MGLFSRRKTKHGAVKDYTNLGGYKGVLMIILPELKKND
jgi:hypothetical protein